MTIIKPPALLDVPLADRQTAINFKQIGQYLKSLADHVGSLPSMNEVQVAVQTPTDDLVALEEKVDALAADFANEPSYTASSFLPGYSVLYESSPGVAAIADNSALSTSTTVIGLAGGNTLGGYPVTLIGVGETATNGAWNWIPNLPVFLGTSGALTQTLPTTNVVQVGVAINATSVLVNPQQVVLLGSGQTAQALGLGPDGQIVTFAGTSVTPAQDTFTPTAGQTSFTLSNTPKALSVFALVNAVDLINGTDFTVSGNTVTILSGLGYTLQPTDQVQFRYLEA